MDGQQRRKAVALLLKFKGHEVDDENFVGVLQCFEHLSGVFSEAAALPQVSPVRFWSFYYKESPLAELGVRFCSLPASSAAVERLWSAADFQCAGRERITAKHLFHELFVRINRKACDCEE